jgi:hypothetical protein
VIAIGGEDPNRDLIEARELRGLKTAMTGYENEISLSADDDDRLQHTVLAQ